MIITGLAAVFYDERDPGTIYERDGVVERIHRGSFARSIRLNDLKTCISHRDHQELVRQSTGVLVVEETAKGLFFAASVPDHRARQYDFHPGDIRGASWCGRIVRESKTPGHYQGRSIIWRDVYEIDLLEVGPGDIGRKGAYKACWCMAHYSDREAQAVNDRWLRVQDSERKLGVYY